MINNHNPMRQTMTSLNNHKASLKRPEMNQILVSNNNSNNNSKKKGMDYLTIPKLTKQFLISPPASPPTDWQPVHEGAPVIDVQLISAIANLVPGEVHEIHSGNENQPGIFVEVCEDVQYEPPPSIITDDCDDIDEIPQVTQRIPKTPCPAAYQCRSPENADRNTLINTYIDPHND